MVTTALMVLTMSSPVLAVLALLVLAEWRDRRRVAMIARQVRLTDAIANELGSIVAPVVTKPLGRPWRVDIQVPVGRPATVSRIVGIAHDILNRTGAGRYELVLTPDPKPVVPPAAAPRTARRLQAA
jgi:hypothetical protein